MEVNGSRWKSMEADGIWNGSIWKSVRVDGRFWKQLEVFGG